MHRLLTTGMHCLSTFTLGLEAHNTHRVHTQYMTHSKQHTQNTHRGSIQHAHTIHNTHRVHTQREYTICMHSLSTPTLSLDAAINGQRLQTHQHTRPPTYLEYTFYTWNWHLQSSLFTIHTFILSGRATAGRGVDGGDDGTQWWVSPTLALMSLWCFSTPVLSFCTPVFMSNLIVHPENKQFSTSL